MTARDFIDLDPLTISQLEQLAKRVGQEIARKRAAGREWLQKHGTQVTETDAPKYQNPKNVAQTWSGKGKQPHWIEEMLAQGHSLASLLSDDALPATRRSGGGREGER